MASLLKFLLFLTVFLTPLLGALKDLGYEQIKVFFFIVSISLISFVWILQKPVIKLSRIGYLSLVFIIILFLTSLLGVNPTTSILGIQPYFQGAILYAYLFLFSLIVKESRIKIEEWAKVLVGSSTIVAFLAIKDWVLLNIFHQIVPNYAGRVVSSFGQPNFYAGYLLLSLPFSYFLFKNSNRRLSYFGLIAGFLSIIGIFVSYSRSAILLSLILVALGLIDQLKIKLKLVIFALVIILISSFLALKFSSGLVGNEFSRPLNTDNPDLTKESVEKRVYIWPQAFNIFLEKSINGYGLENISFAFANYFQIHKHKIFEENLKIRPVLISLKDLNIDRTHNYILDLLVFSGVFGVIIWFLLTGLLIKKCKNKYLLTGLLTYLLWVQFQNQSIV